MAKTKRDPWEAARWLAKQERHDPFYREMQQDSDEEGGNVGDRARARHERLKTKNLEFLADEPNFDELMAEAREYVAAEDAREEALRNSILGQLQQALTNVSAYQYKNVQELREFYIANHSEPDFVDAEVEKTWRCFLDAWADWDCPGTFEHLGQLVEFAYDELSDKPLPPIPYRKGRSREDSTPLDETPICQLKEALETIVVGRTSLKELSRYLGENPFNDTFEGLEGVGYGADWHRFIAAMSKRRLPQALEALIDLVQTIDSDLLWTELGE